MPKEFIVAIELGSSKMTGIAGKKNLDGSIQVLAVVKEESSSFIRKGYVYNIDKTAQCLATIVSKLEKQLKTTITQVYVGVGGQSIRSVRNVISKELPADTVVTQNMVIELMDSNRNMKYPDQEILDAAVQEYKVDSQYQLDPVGIQCNHIEGNFLNILQRKAFYKKVRLLRRETEGDGRGRFLVRLEPPGRPGRQGDCILPAPRQARHDDGQCVLQERAAPPRRHPSGWQ